MIPGLATCLRCRCLVIAEARYHGIPPDTHWIVNPCRDDRRKIAMLRISGSFDTRGDHPARRSHHRCGPI